MTKNKKGFTIIEVVLVLAIAGLIFLMVFIALPALQRSQRNTRRRQDMSRILSAFNDYQANNNGRMPKDDTALGNLVKSYIGANQAISPAADAVCDGDQFCDPDGTPYAIGFGDTLTATGETAKSTLSGEFPNGHKIFYYKTAKCSEAEGEVEYSAGNNNIAIMFVLEGNAVYCGDNQ